MEREVRYCSTSDGVRIAYCVKGQGPALLWSPLMFESLTREAMTPVIAQFLGRLREHFRVVRFDTRGTGLSQTEVDDFTPAATGFDIEAVLQAAGVERVLLLAQPGWAIHFLIYAANHPDSVAGLVVWNGQASMEEAMPVGIYDSMVQMVRANWALASRTLADFGGRMFGDEPLKLGEACRESCSGQTAAKLFEANRFADAAPILGDISCPVLVLVNGDMLPHFLDSSQRLATGISSARLVMLDKHEYVLHPSALGRPLETIVNFFAECDPSVLPTSETAERRTDAVRTVLFTDLVGHTEMMSRLGDDRGRDVLREHERITREVLKANGGTEVKTMGDGFMASFGSVTKAVECAVALQRAFADREGEPLNVRVGLNAGEPIEEDGDLFGATVILASRIAAKAEGGEILVADTVRGLCSGKGFLFADRGEFAAKGFEEPVRVYEVNWRHTTAS